MTLEETNDLDVIASLSSTESMGDTAETSAETPTEAPVTETAQPDPQVAELERLRRVIAGNPDLRQQYETSLYQEFGETPPPVQQQQQPQEQAPVEFQPPFDLTMFDPTDGQQQLQLMQSVITHQLSQALQPFAAFIQEQQAENQRYEMEKQQRQMMDQGRSVLSEMNTLIPGFDEVSKGTSEDQDMVNQFAADLYVKAAQEMGIPQGLWFNEKVIKQVASQIAPKVKKFGSSLGVFSNQSNTVQQREMYVEGSNAVPATNRNSFDAAFESGDTRGMIKAIGL